MTRKREELNDRFKNAIAVEDTISTTPARWDEEEDLGKKKVRKDKQAIEGP